MIKTTCTAFTLALILSRPSLAQTQPTTPAPDLTPILSDLANNLTHDATLAKAKALPLSSVFTMWDYLDDTSNPLDLRKDISAALESIYARERPIRAAKDHQDLAKWWQTTGIDVYKKMGTNRPWDELIVKGLDEINSRTPGGVATLKSAIDAGCKDPLIRYLYAINALEEHSVPVPDGIRLLDVASADLDNSAYPASRKFFAHLEFALYAGKPECPPDISEDRKFVALRTAINSFPKLVAEHPGRILLKQAVSDLYPAATQLYHATPEESAYIQIQDTIHATLPQDPAVNSLEAEYFLETSWNAIAYGMGKFPDAQQWKTSTEKAQAALQAADKGWHLDPLDPDCPASAIVVCWMNSLDRHTMETWFSRATLADPHNFRACYSKIAYLIDRVGSSDALDFGRYCVKNGTARDRLPWVLVYAHQIFGSNSSSAEAYFERPEVWQDLKSAYDKLLADKSLLQSSRSPYLADRAQYVKYACQCKQWTAAAALIKEFDDEVDADVIGGKALYDYFRKKVQTELAGPR